MNKTTKGFLAGAIGIGLLLGGATLALWTDRDGLGGETIESGHLAVEVRDAQWRDISTVRRGAQAINLNEFKIIPGDVLEGRYPVHVGLEGRNMMARLSLTSPGGTNGLLAEGLSVGYEIQDADGRRVDVAGDEGAAVVRLASDDGGRSHGAIRVNQTTADGPDFHVVVTVKFNENAGLSLTEAQASLAEAELELRQIRETAYDARN